MAVSFRRCADPALSSHRTAHTTDGESVGVTSNDEIWIGQNGKRSGPHTETVVRQWLAAGKLAHEALAWREGMPDWVRLDTLFSAAASYPPLSVPAPDDRSATGTEPTDSPSSRIGEATNDTDKDRAALPMPPSLPWGLLLLFTLLSFGIFGIIWPFIQASWIRKIDKQSKARPLLAAAFVTYLVGYFVFVVGISTRATGGAVLAGVGCLLLLNYWVLFLVAYFSMAGSVRRILAAHGLPVVIGGATLFFFNTLYLQGQLRWIARWKISGQSVPKAPKGVFWLLLLLSAVVLGILAGIAVPAYQSYLVRSQVAMSTRLSDGAKMAFTDYYQSHHSAPPDNAAAGLAASASIADKYVSSVDVSGGRITVSFNTPSSYTTIRDKILVLTPALNEGRVSWTCTAGTTVANSYLPSTCRR